jgi:hypothetical protein
MHRKYHYLSSLLVLATLSFPLLAITQQDAHPRHSEQRRRHDDHQQRSHDNRKTPDDGRVYDSSRHDYHPWNDAEDRAYRKYLIQNHKPYREFEQNSRKEQARYWTWRHAHPDRKNRVGNHR